MEVISHVIDGHKQNRKTANNIDRFNSLGSGPHGGEHAEFFARGSNKNIARWLYYRMFLRIVRDVGACMDKAGSETPLLATTVSDPEQGLTAFVIVDSLFDGRAMGGVRMTPTVSFSEVAGLARKMTLKLALAELPIGGAKAGIVNSHELGVQRDERLQAFGRSVAPLLHGGIYLGSDMGITYRDRDLFFEAAEYEVQNHINGGGVLCCTWSELWNRCEDITGVGVAEGAFVAAERFDLQSAEKRVVIQGFGAVGRAVARHMASQGYRIVGVADRLGTVADPHGLSVEELVMASSRDGLLDRTKLSNSAVCTDALDAWLKMDAEVLVLAAGGMAIHESNVNEVRAKIVVEGANTPCAPSALPILASRGIHVLPDIVVNAGGAAVTALILTGLAPVIGPLDELASWLFKNITARIRSNMETIIERTKNDHSTLPRVALAMAEERVHSRKKYPLTRAEKVRFPASEPPQSSYFP